MQRRRSAASNMIGGDIVSIGLPDRLAIAPLAKETHPDHKIAAIGPQAVRRAYTHGWARAKKPIEIVLVAPIIIQDEGHTFAQASLLRRRDRGGGEDRPSVRHHRTPVKSGQFGEIELRNDNRLCGGLRTGGLKPASAQTTTSSPESELIHRSVELRHDTRETRPQSQDNSEALSQQTGKSVEVVKLIPAMLARFMSTDRAF